MLQPGVPTGQLREEGTGRRGKSRKRKEDLFHLKPKEVLGFEVIWGAPAPVDYVFVLALTAQLPVPVGHSEVVIHQRLTDMAVLQDRVEERLCKAQKGQDTQWDGGQVVNGDPHSEEKDRPQLLLNRNLSPFPAHLRTRLAPVLIWPTG